jgi:hypothetical protein
MFEVAQAESSPSHERCAAVRGSKHSSARGSTGSTGSTGSVKAAGDDSVGDLLAFGPWASTGGAKPTVA